VDAILYICHGSRDIAAQKEADAFIKACMKDNIEIIQEYAFLELASPTLEEAFLACVKRGATNIIVAPVLLLRAAHAKRDIPTELAQIRCLYPKVNILYASPFGVHPSMVDLLSKRLSETNEPVTAKSIVLIVGRGSSDPEVKRDLTRIAYLLKEKRKLARVEVCYLSVASPSFSESLLTIRNTEYDKLFVIPYLLFSGVLMENIQRELAVNSDLQKFVLCKNLGYDRLISQVLQERAKEAVPFVR
jgi:sirohydrochlorin ferrochelatase